MVYNNMKNTLTIVWLLLLTIHNSTCEKKKVCVIGAGPCGLAAIRVISAFPDEFEPVAFERNSDVGGLWIYTDKTGYDEHDLPIHSSMYKNLRTNAPKELMTYPDYRDFHGEEHSCVRHETVLEYLRNYTDHFNLRQFIKFNTYVKKVTFLGGQVAENWVVKTINLITDEREYTDCHAMMVCNGNLFDGHYPTIHNIERFRGRAFHSHWYRKPEMFTNQTVVILGASFSGIDIGIEVSKYAKKVYLSHRRDKIESELPSNIEQIPGVVEATRNQLILSNRSAIVADAIIYCTGYDYYYPFLEQYSNVEVDYGKFVHPLYKNLINAVDPTMAFLGLARDNVGFSTYDIQARYFLSVLRGDTKLPSYEEMLEDAKMPEGVGIGHLHDFGDDQWRYYADLAEAGKFEGLPLFYEKGFKMWIPFFDKNLMTFRNSDLRVLDDENVEIVQWKDD